MMRYRRFVSLFIVFIALFIGCNYLIWKLWTEDLISNIKYQGGDLARMGYLPRSKFLRINSTDLPRTHIHIKDYDGRRIDMLTVGDSFSNGGAGGKNRFYQDYIATFNGLEVLNIPRYKELDPLTTVSVFNNNGLLDRIKPKYVMIGVDEKVGAEMAGPLNLSLSLNKRELLCYKEQDYYLKPPRVPFINNGNFKFLLYNIIYGFSDHALSGIYMRKLREDFFSVPNRDVLVFLRYKRLPTTNNITNMNNNLNRLADELEKKGIQLVFMPCVDKYNLYSDYLVNNPYPKSIFFEELRKLPKRYRLIDTKAILGEELRKGEKDIFYADDTHWSWKAAKKIFETTRF